jgi:ABC-type transport system involved in multi-copper enzyme maturation permease subunit
MSSSPAVMSGDTMKAPDTRPYSERFEVPAKWRLGQMVVIGLIFLLAIYYNTTGWKSGAAETGAADAVTIFDQIGFLILAGLVWLTTPTAATIALSTFQEALRRRWMTALLGFALAIIALSTFFTWMQPGEEEKFLRDFGIGFIILMTLLMSIFLGVALVPPEVERRTIFTILSKPVDRLEFLIGKFMGLCLTLLVNLLAMAILFLIAYTMYRVRREGGFSEAMAVTEAQPGLIYELSNLSAAIILHYGQLAIMAALALTLSLVVSNITAIIFSFLAYFGGQMSSYWEHLGTEHGQNESGTGLSGPMQRIVSVVYFLLPRLDRFDVRERLVQDMPIGFNYVWKAFDSGLIYVAVLLTIAYLIFSDREF